VIGAPGVGSGFLSFQGGVSYLQTSIPESVEQTFIVVARTSDTLADDAHRPHFIGNYRGPAQANPALLSAGVGLQVSSATQTSIYVGRSADGTTLSNQNLAMTLVPTTWHMLVCRAGSNRAGVWSLTSNVRNDTTGNSPRFMNTGLHKIGSAADRYLGSSDMAVAVISSAYLTDAEVVANGKKLAGYLAARFGIGGLIHSSL
jgi:hypothetical protein